MSRYFKPVELSEPAKRVSVPKKNPETYVVPSKKPRDLKKEMDGFHTELMRMVSAVERGESDLCRATSFVGSALPNAIQRMQAAPSGKNIRDVLNLCQSDINRRFRQEVDAMLQSGSYPGLADELKK